MTSSHKSLESTSLDIGAQTVDAARGPDCLIHIGYHRTGSSFLQTELFPLIPDSFVTADLDKAERNAANTTLRHVIISSERLSSNLERDKPELAYKLAQRFPNAHILIVIRSQYSVMRGIYHLHIKGGATEDYETFVRFRCGRLFNYDELVGAYQDAFGEDKVFILLHEDLVRDPMTSMSALLTFMGADSGLAAKVHNRRVKPSSGDVTLAIQRYRNRAIAPLRWLWPRAHSEITGCGLPGARLIERWFGNWYRLPTDRVRTIIRETYAEGNQRLFVSLGLNARDYDYPHLGQA
jgi:Sulfotransferase family